MPDKVTYSLSNFFISDFLERKKIYFYLITTLLIFSFQLIKHLVIFDGGLFRIGPDARYYIGALENLFLNGEYQLNGAYNDRMPGFLPIYLPLRFFFSQHLTLSIMSIVKVLFYSFSVVFFSSIIGKFLKKGVLFVFVLVLLLGVSDYICYWGFVYYTESLAGSCLMMGLAFFIKGINEKNSKTLLFSGFFIAWLIFLRPFMIVVWVFLILFLFYFHYKLQIKNKLKFALVFALTFLVFNGVWITRNYGKERQFIPLQKGWNRTESFKNYRKFIASFGGDAVEWNPGSEGMWFQTDEYLEQYEFKRPSDDIFPSIILSESFTIDSLKNLRAIYWKTKDASLANGEYQFYDSLFVQKTNIFIDSFRKSNSGYFWITARFKLFFDFLVHPYTYYLRLTSSEKGMQYFLKAFIYLINASVFILGTISAFYFAFRQLLPKFHDKKHVLLLATPLFLFALFPFYLRFIEYRFAVLAFPFLAIYLSLALSNTIQKIFKNSY